MSSPHLSNAPGVAPRLQLTGITKRYPAVVANSGVSLTVQPGEIHAVLGENGAGKSTLMKIIYGSVKPDEGTVSFNGQPVHIRNPQEARKLGISMVFQHFSLFDTLTVAENVWLGLDASLSLGSGGRAAPRRPSSPRPTLRPTRPSSRPWSRRWHCTGRACGPRFPRSYADLKCLEAPGRQRLPIGCRLQSIVEVGGWRAEPSFPSLNGLMLKIKLSGAFVQRPPSRQRDNSNM